MATIVIIWLFLAIFNTLKIMQTDGKDICIGETLVAIFLSPLYAFIALVAYFIIGKWPHQIKFK